MARKNTVLTELSENLDQLHQDTIRQLREKDSKRVDVKIVTSKATFTSGAWSGIDFELAFDTVGFFILNENPDKKIIVGVKYVEESKKVVSCFRNNYEPTNIEKEAFEEIVAAYIEEYIKKASPEIS